MTAQKPGLQIVPALTEDQDTKVSDLLRAVSPILQVTLLADCCRYMKRMCMPSVPPLEACLVQQPVKVLDLAAHLYVASQTCPDSMYALASLRPVTEGSNSCNALAPHMFVSGVKGLGVPRPCFALRPAATPVLLQYNAYAGSRQC